MLLFAMHNPERVLETRIGVVSELEKLRKHGPWGLNFPSDLEQCFERDTAKPRSMRLWREGLIAIVVFNACLVVDNLLVRDAMLHSIVQHTVIVTPLALLVNALMLLNPPRWLREGSVGLATILICFINLKLEGSNTPATALFGVICLLIMVLFSGVVMRLRFHYAAVAMGSMLAGGLWFARHAAGLRASEQTVAGSLMVIGAAMVLTATYSLEREERLSYLLCLQSDLQGADLFKMNAELERLSNVDKLTGLPNRRSLESRFETLWVEGERLGTSLSAIVIDVDHFKVINDVYGHLYGDEALRRIAGLLPQALRGQEDFAGRFGGEEFVILLPNTDRETALGVADRVRRLVEVAGTPVTEHPSGETMLWATVSCGVSLCVPDGKFHRDNLLRAADKALYEAKGNGRNRVEFKECEWELRVSESRAGRRSGSRLLAKLTVRRDKSGAQPAHQAS